MKRTIHRIVTKDEDEVAELKKFSKVENQDTYHLRSRSRRDGTSTRFGNVVTPSSSQSPSRKKSSGGFSSCLEETGKHFFVDLNSVQPSPRSVPAIVLQRALSMNEVSDESWLSSSFIDLCFAQFAKIYQNIRYLSVDLCTMLSKATFSKRDYLQITDINGKIVDYSDLRRPIVFIVNSQNIHWNLIRVVRYPQPQLQLFEPMGMPHNRHGGLNFRNVPRAIITWLDSCCPLRDGQSWINLGVSAIVKQQQMTSYDCGVACLLYAEKCGRGEVKTTLRFVTIKFILLINR